MRSLIVLLCISVINTGECPFSGLPTSLTTPYSDDIQPHYSFLPKGNFDPRVVKLIQPSLNLSDKTLSSVTLQVVEDATFNPTYDDGDAWAHPETKTITFRKSLYDYAIKGLSSESICYEYKSGDTLYTHVKISPNLGIRIFLSIFFHEWTHYINGHGSFNFLKMMGAVLTGKLPSQYIQQQKEREEIEADEGIPSHLLGAAYVESTINNICMCYRQESVTQALNHGLVSQNDVLQKSELEIRYHLLNNHAKQIHYLHDPEDIHLSHSERAQIFKERGLSDAQSQFSNPECATVTLYKEDAEGITILEKRNICESFQEFTENHTK